VLVDAPCSGFGTLRRNPDLKWRHGAAAIGELAAKQSRILNAAARLVKPGGRLVYATCSILPDENDAVVDAFAAGHAEFKELSCADLLASQRIPQDTGGGCGSGRTGTVPTDFLRPPSRGPDYQRMRRPSVAKRRSGEEFCMPTVVSTWIWLGTIQMRRPVCSVGFSPRCP
jgi:hypothetical protein